MNYPTALAELDVLGWQVEVGLPRSLDQVLLRLRTPGGKTVAGQWFHSAERARHVARQTQMVCPDASVSQPAVRILTQADGADRKLAALAALTGRPGARLVAHRPERRGVVAHDDAGQACYTKVVRPGRLTAATPPPLPGIRQPAVLEADPIRGTVTTAALPGRTLHALLAEPADRRPALTAAGTALARLHAIPPAILPGSQPGQAPTHGPAAEIDVLRRWWRLAAGLGVAPAHIEPTVRRTETALLNTDPALSVLHRDLHDKQLLLDDAAGGTHVGLLDLDLLTMGDPALDLANLVVHLELRARQGRFPLDQVQPLVAALTAGYRPDTRTRAAFAAYQLATRLRLQFVYAFRPASRAAAAALITDPLTKELP
ncbi:MAG: phosphotransferase family protein [Propioniciclava sp.]